jgi:3-oxoadipate enol-lactonase
VSNGAKWMVEVDDTRLAVRVDGPVGAPVLLLCNSLSSDMSMWDEQVARWAGRFRILRYDQRGHGDSPVPPEGADWTIDRLGRDAVAVLDALGVERAHVCGVSLGGMTGLWMGISAPARVDHLVLANTAAEMGPTSLWDGRIELARSGGMEAVATPTIERWFPAPFRGRCDRA